MLGRSCFTAIAGLLLLAAAASAAHGQPILPSNEPAAEALPPLTPAAITEIRQYVRELDSESFALRERASHRLRQMDERVVPFLEAAQTSPSLEVRMRVKSLLSRVHIDPLATFCALPDSQLSDEHGMFLISQILNPQVKKESLTKQLDDLATQVRAKLKIEKDGKPLNPADIDPQVVVATIRQVLFEEQKFAGNALDYDNPNNSSLEKVLATRKGLPVTLSRIVVLVARRMDVPIVGVPASGRYIVKYDGSRAPVGFPKEDIYFHPFEGGKILSREDRQMLYPGHDPDVMVPPDTNRAALIRILNNLNSDLDHDPERAAQLTRANEMLLLLQQKR